MEFYTAYNNPPPQVKVDFTGDPGMTIQTDMPKCDIHNILEFHCDTGLWNHVNSKPGEYGFHTGKDYRESLQALQETQEAFEKLPSRIRNRFDNDPSKLLEFMEDPSNSAEGEELGLYQGRTERNGQNLQSSQAVSSGESQKDGSDKA